MLSLQRPAALYAYAVRLPCQPRITQNNSNSRLCAALPTISASSDTGEPHGIISIARTGKLLRAKRESLAF